MIDWLADGVALLHGGLLLLECAGAAAVLCGAFRSDRLVRWQWAYLGLVGARSLCWLILQDCPLTLLERSLRELGTSGVPFADSFVEHYLPWLPPRVDLALTLLLAVAGLMGILQAATRGATFLVRHPSKKGLLP